MVVALRTTDGLAQPHGAHVAHAVGQHPGFIVLGLRAAFLGGKQEAVVGGGDFLFERAVGEQVAGQLLARELVEGFVVVEGFDDVIAIRPNI